MRENCSLVDNLYTIQTDLMSQTIEILREDQDKIKMVVKI